MNIFVLSDNPFEAASMQCDKHVVKMLVESTQILSTTLHQFGIPAPYKPTHVNHPCCKWARESSANHEWLLTHAFALLNEYHFRYGDRKNKIHACTSHLTTIADTTIDFKSNVLTPFALCMPEKYKVIGDPVTSYRNFYLTEKRSFAKWKNGRNAPAWWNNVGDVGV